MDIPKGHPSGVDVGAFMLEVEPRIHDKLEEEKWAQSELTLRVVHLTELILNYFPWLTELILNYFPWLVEQWSQAWYKGWSNCLLSV